MLVTATFHKFITSGFTKFVQRRKCPQLLLTYFFFLKDPVSKSRLDYKLKVTFHLKMVKLSM